MFILGLLLLITIAGVTLSIWAWRGKRIDDHPICRKCGFDLFGRPKVMTCPECGVILDSVRGVRQGNRQRRSVALTAGSALLLLAIGSGGVFGYVTLSGPRVLKSLPVWAVRWDAYYGGGWTSAKAVKELLRRLKTGGLSKAQIGAVAADALAAQADASRTWDPAWGDFIDTAHAQKLLPKQYWKQYATVLAHHLPTLNLRRVVRQGAPLPCRLTYSNVRCGHHPRMWISLFAKSINFNGKVEKVSQGIGGPGFSATGICANTSRLTLPTPPALGPQRVALRIRGRLRDSWGPQAKILVQVEETLHGKTTIVPPNQPTVRAVNDAREKAPVQQAMQVEYLSVRPAWGGQKGLRLSCNLQMGKRPVGVAFEVAARDHAGHIWKIGSISGAPNSATEWGLSCEPFKGCKSAYLDIVLTPSAKVAERSVDVSKYWGKPIVLKHIKVDWSQVPKAQRPKAFRSHP